MSESLLYNWRSARKTAAVAMGASENVEFIPVGVIEGPATRGLAMLAPPTPEPAPQSPSSEGKTGSTEIAVPNGVRVSVDAFVNEKALSRVLRAIDGTTREKHLGCPRPG